MVNFEFMKEPKGAIKFLQFVRDGCGEDTRGIGVVGRGKHVPRPVAGCILCWQLCLM
jgi:hypothetical protein